jgi:hypothetical protein
MITYEQLCGPEPKDEDKPWLDRSNVSGILSWLTTDQFNWVMNGVVIKKGFVPDEIISKYREVRDALPLRAWDHPTPYMECPELLDISTFPELVELQRSLLGVDVGLHLNLTDYLSTERKFHADTYLNPKEVGGHYLAVWIALDDISEDCGPFEYVPGSHKWPAMSRDALFKLAPKELLHPDRWPTLTQDIVGQACEDEITRRNAQVVKYLPKKGDLLVWHANLIHRGSTPTDPNAVRRAVIGHYSSIHHRSDMPAPVQHGSGWYFPIVTLNTGTTR